jgi:hypothetical protein
MMLDIARKEVWIPQLDEIDDKYLRPCLKEYC